MIYEFTCPEHGRFEVKRLMRDCGLPASCPECGEEARRNYSMLEWIWDGSAYRSDGSLRQQNDYAPLKGDSRSNARKDNKK